MDILTEGRVRRIIELADLVLKDGDSVRQSLLRYRWKSAIPTAPGWYWYRSKISRMKVIEIYFDHDGILTSSERSKYGEKIPHGVLAEWAGPLESPDV
jgi:hypothetical protein